MPRDIVETDALDTFLRENRLCILYFTTPGCGVCKVLKPKLQALLAERFPQMGFAQVDCAAAPSLAANMGVFAVPTLIVFAEGRESLRKSRSFGLGELAAGLERPYRMLFDD